MKKILYYIPAFSILITLISCEIVFTQEQKIKKQVSDMLVDADSAKFGEILQGKPNNFFCGSVNSKNRMGGYVGSTPFIYEKVTDNFGVVTLVDQPPKSNDFSLLRLSSGDRFEELYLEILRKCKALDSYEKNCNGSASLLPEMCRYMISDNDEFSKQLREKY